MNSRAVWTTATVSRNYAFLVYETLYGMDAKLNAKPQMVSGHTVSDDGKRWTMALRPGLTFHDGEKVLARDCVASLQRWMKRDAIGQLLGARLDALEAPDDRTLVFRLNKPFAALPYALGKTQPSAAVIMPARLAAADPFKPVTEAIGNGPYKFEAKEFNSGNLAVFTKHTGYVPRDEPPDFTAGGKRAYIERIEWRIVPEAATAANALAAGEVDWVEQPIP
ncbi:MAG: ABC transporter substrate-binding protein, partial [Rhodospirillales bacterium]|nr:ABC transporter substrate-binding protein [Rhodospirillales bacterium]